MTLEQIKSWLENERLEHSKAQQTYEMRNGMTFSAGYDQGCYFVSDIVLDMIKNLEK